MRATPELIYPMLYLLCAMAVCAASIALAVRGLRVRAPGSWHLLGALGVALTGLPVIAAWHSQIGEAARWSTLMGSSLGLLAIQGALRVRS